MVLLNIKDKEEEASLQLLTSKNKSKSSFNSSALYTQTLAEQSTVSERNMTWRGKQQRVKK